jgi:DNA-3-methyladenine glycosylase II
MQVPSTNGRHVLPFRPALPLDARVTLARYGQWGADPANPYHDGVLYRVTRVAGRLIPFRLASRGRADGLRVTLEFAGPDTPAVRQALRRDAACLLGAGWDLAGFYRMAATDPVLAPLVRSDGGLYGLRPTLAPDPFEMLVCAISAQQVNLTFALATRARLVRRCGEPVVLDGVTVYAFPAPATVAALRPETLRSMQFSERKAEYIIGVAGELASGRLDLAALGTAPDAAIVDRLTAVRGCGQWTAEWFLARALGRPDVCPADDLGVRRAVEALCFGGRVRDARAVRLRARAWRPYRTMAIHYLLAAHHRARLAARAARAGA